MNLIGVAYLDAEHKDEVLDDQCELYVEEHGGGDVDVARA